MVSVGNSSGLCTMDFRREVLLNTFIGTTLKKICHNVHKCLNFVKLNEIGIKNNV